MFFISNIPVPIPKYNVLNISECYSPIPRPITVVTTASAIDDPEANVPPPRRLDDRESSLVPASSDATSFDFCWVSSRAAEVLCAGVSFILCDEQKSRLAISDEGHEIGL